jgi:hypothetical protein
MGGIPAPEQIRSSSAPLGGTKDKKYTLGEKLEMGGIQAPERIRSSSEPVGGTKNTKHTSGEKLKMGGLPTPQKKGSGSESVGGIGGVIEAGLDFEFGLVGLHGSGSPPTKVERMVSVAKRVKPGKVKEMVMKFNAVVEQEEVARKVSEEPTSKVSGESTRKVGGMGLEDLGAKIEVTGALDQAEAVRNDQEEHEDTLGDIVLTYQHDDRFWKEEELLKHGEDMKELDDIYDYYDTYNGTEEAGDRKEMAWKVEETGIEIAQKSGHEDVAVEIKETEGQGQKSMIEKLDETTGHIDMATKSWWVNETLGQGSIATKAEEVAHQNEIIADITRSLYPEDNIPKIDSRLIRTLTDSGVDENFDGNDTCTYLDSALDEDTLATDLIGLTVDVPSTRMSTLVREYSELVSPVSELDDSPDLQPEPSISPPLRQNSDLISPLTEFDTDYASSRPITPADPVDNYHLAAELSPSTTPLLQRARTGSLPNSHHSIASAVGACSGFSSNYSDYSPSSPSHDQDTTQHTSLTTTSTSDPFYIPPSSTNTPSFTTSSTPFTPQTFSGSFDSFVDAGAFAPFTPPVSFEDFLTSLPRDLEHEGEGEGGVLVQEDEFAEGLQSLLYVPADGTIWNWDGSRWVGQREDGSLVLGFELF